MANPAFVFEDILTTPKQRVGALLGIPLYITPYFWLNLVGSLALGFVFSLLAFPGADLLARLVWMLVYALLFQGVLFAHDIGHILSGRLARAPMDYLLLTATRHINRYEGDQSQFPPRTHILRASGGPAGNLVAALIGALLWLLLGSIPALGFWTIANLLTGLGALAPTDSVDGGTIAYYLHQMRH